MAINYETLSEITVKNQAELDMIPEDFKGVIYIEFGTYFTPAVVRHKYFRRVVARGNSSVEAWENSSVEAWENSSVVARGNSSVVARGNSSVEAWENSSVEAWGNSSVEAWENSSVEARENSSVVARGNSSVVALGNSQIVNRLSGGRINISGNARVVYMPKTIIEYCDFYGLEHDKKTGRFFKCVHKVNGRYLADKDGSFEYAIGEKAIPDAFDDNPLEDCGHGIHVAYLDWVLDYGRNWSDIAIIEVEAKLKDIVVPQSAVGKVRCKEVTVIREVPLEECGLFGKMLAKRRAVK